MKSELAEKLVTTALLILSVVGCSTTINAATKEQVSLSQEKVNQSLDYLNRDVKDDVFYFVLPDRFNNANPDNDMGSKTHDISRGGLDATSKWAFHGGDMQGIEEKLDYLQGMGITAIWMTPILRNKAVQKKGFAHHGYWIVDFTQIDPHFGSNDDLKRLIDKAHDRGMKIFFDIITNHTADVIKFEECHQQDGKFQPGKSNCVYKTLAQLAKNDVYTPFVPKNEQQQMFPAWLNNAEYYHNQGDSTFEGESSLYGDFNGLDDLNTEHPVVLKGMIDIYNDIITEYKPDGFRIDTVRHVQLPFWQSFIPAIMQHAKQEGIPKFHIFGEVYDSNPIELSKFTSEGKLPAVLDFAFQSAAGKVFYQKQSPMHLKELFELDDFYNDNDSQVDELLTFLGNHDMGRAGYFLNKHLPEATQDEKLKRSALSHAFMLLSRGVPVVYYGDEQGFTGDGNDVDAREDMFASRVKSYNDNQLLGTSATTAENNFDRTHPIYQTIKTLSALRAQHKTIRRGNFVARYFDQAKNTFAFSRIDNQEQHDYLVVFNLESTPQSMLIDNIDSDYTLLEGQSSHQINDRMMDVQLPAFSFSVYRSNQRVPVATQLDLTLTSVEPVIGDDSRVKVNFKLDSKNTNPVSVLSIVTEIKNKAGQFDFVAKDNAYPYAAIVAKSQFSVNSIQSLKVTVNNENGESKVHHFSF